MENMIDLTNSWIGYLLLIIFFVGYWFMSLEHKYRLNKAKVSLFIGTLMFIILGIYFKLVGLDTNLVSNYISTLIIEIAEIVFFLFVAMTFIEAMVDRNVFEYIKYKLLIRKFSYIKLYWILGFLAFFLSPVIDNLTTALILTTVLITIGYGNKKFILPSAINIVVAANAGGVWSPFGDVTTLMAWMYGKAPFIEFFKLFPSAFLGWLVTAYLLSLFIPSGSSDSQKQIVEVKLKKGAKAIILIFIFTLATAVSLEHFIHIPPMWGMMFGLSILKLYSYYLKVSEECSLDIFKEIRKVEYDTLLFFFGILSAVGALHFIGYLIYITKLYNIIGDFLGNIIIGIVGAVFGNVPVMAAVLKSDIDMGIEGWLFLTLMIGIGGSLISFGSAAGVAVMGRARGIYTFMSHLKYVWTVIVGIIVSIIVFYIQFYIF